MVERCERILYPHRLHAWLTVLTLAGEVPAGGIVKPYVSDARMAQWRDMMRAVVGEDRAVGGGQ